MEQSDIVQHYQTVAELCRTLLATAERGAWDELIALQNDYVGAVERLASLEQGVVFDAPWRERKRALLISIRDTEDAVRTLLEDRMGQLSAGIARSRNQYRVNQAYDSGISG